MGITGTTKCCVWLFLHGPTPALRWRDSPLPCNLLLHSRTGLGKLTRRGAIAVSRIFVSHSSENNAEAVALCDWLGGEGWKDEVFLDLDPTRGIAAGEHWGKKIKEAANRCEAGLFFLF